MLYVIVIATFVYMLSQITKFDANPHILDTLIKETHKYSGIHEDSYAGFYTNIQLAKEHKSEMFLEKALFHLNDIPLYMTTIDPDVQGEIAELGQKIAVTFERVLMKEAMNTNTYFRPKYI